MFRNPFWVVANRILWAVRGLHLLRVLAIISLVWIILPPVEEVELQARFTRDEILSDTSKVATSLIHDLLGHSMMSRLMIDPLAGQMSHHMEAIPNHSSWLSTGKCPPPFLLDPLCPSMRWPLSASAVDEHWSQRSRWSGLPSYHVIDGAAHLLPLHHYIWLDWGRSMYDPVCPQVIRPVQKWG